MLQKNNLIVSCRSIDKSYGSFVALKDITFNLHAGEKVGLVGANGTGKTTLLKIIAGIEEQDTGTISYTKKISIGYIPQSFEMHNEQSVSQFLCTTKKLAIDSQLRKLGLTTTILDKYIAELSGGEKTKIALVKILISEHDLYLLDEPTNNLDIESLTILENFIQESNKTFLIVSHDRMFLDMTINKILSIDEHSKRSSLYNGSFSAYLAEKELSRERQWKKYDDFQEKKNKLQKIAEEKNKNALKMNKVPKRDNDKFVKNFKTEMGQRTMQRGARLLKERIASLQEIEKPVTLRPLKISFPNTIRSGNKVFEMKDVRKIMNGKPLGPFTLSVQCGDRIVLTGKNGVGKSTILKMLVKQLSPDSGSITYGACVMIGYLPQESYFTKTATVLEIAQKEIGIEESQARKTLNRFRITDDDTIKKMSELSSGERSRLLLALIMTKEVNCIILDEPTNHIDIEVLQELEEALLDFKGTLIAVSHDRYFIQKMKFNKVFEVSTTIKNSSL